MTLITSFDEDSAEVLGAVHPGRELARSTRTFPLDHPALSFGCSFELPWGPFEEGSVHVVVTPVPELASSWGQAPRAASREGPDLWASRTGQQHLEDGGWRMEDGGWRIILLCSFLKIVPQIPSLAPF